MGHPIFDPNHHNYNFLVATQPEKYPAQRHGLLNKSCHVMAANQDLATIAVKVFLTQRSCSCNCFSESVAMLDGLQAESTKHTKPSTSKSPKIPKDPNSAWFSAQIWVDFNGEWRKTASNRLMPMDVHGVTDSGNKNIPVFMCLACGDLNRLVLHSPTSPVRGSPLNENLQERRRHCFNCVTGRVGR